MGAGNCAECKHAKQRNGLLVCWVDGCGIVTGAGGTCPKWEKRKRKVRR